MSKPTPETNILRMVKQQCKAHGVRFMMTSKEPENQGGFCSVNKILTLSTKVFRDPTSKETQTPTPEALALTALHEMVHLWQWARKERYFNYKVDGIDAYTMLLDYLNGVEWYSKDKLRQCLPVVANIEFEAESLSFHLAKSMGLGLESYTDEIKGSKASCYSWYVAVETGITPSPLIMGKWKRHISATLTWDLTKDLLKKLCKITEENKHLAEKIWKGKECFTNEIK